MDENANYGFDIKSFTTAQEIAPCRNPAWKRWVIAIDVGFSSVKGLAPNKRFCFPSYVKKMDDRLTSVEDGDIYYRDETGTYLVGASAQDLVRADDTNDTDSSFDRNRYFTKEFGILARVAVAIGLLDDTGKRPNPMVTPYIQTGLPAAYVKEDAQKIRSAFMAPGAYEIKVGDGRWQKFENTLQGGDISVMSQPAGTLNSIMVDDNGEYHPDARKIAAQNVLIADIGFGTFDPYGIVNRKVVLQESINNLGMKKVLETASGYIYKEHKLDLRIPQMRKYLKDGYFRVTDIQNMSSKKVPIGGYVEAACREVAEASVKKLYEMAGYFADYDLLVVTGGTGAAWLPYFKDILSGMESLEIIPGNHGNSLPMHYANARGYYMSAFIRDRRR